MVKPLGLLLYRPMRRAAIVWLLCLGCATSSGSNDGPRDVSRTELPHDLSGEWNDVDADLVAQAMIADCLKSPWIDRWAAAHGGERPVLRLHPIRNRTTGYIDYRFFTKQIEAALIRSGKIDVVASAEETGPVVSDGEVDSSPVAEGPPADFVLNGWIVSQDDRAGDREVRAYLTSIEIIELASQKKAWVGQKQIRKLIQR